MLLGQRHRKAHGEADTPTDAYPINRECTAQLHKRSIEWRVCEYGWAEIMLLRVVEQKTQIRAYSWREKPLNFVIQKAANTLNSWQMNIDYVGIPHSPSCHKDEDHRHNKSPAPLARVELVDAEPNGSETVSLSYHAQGLRRNLRCSLRVWEITRSGLRTSPVSARFIMYAGQSRIMFHSFNPRLPPFGTSRFLDNNKANSEQWGI